METLIACDDTQSGDDALDQQSYYGYDDAGRTIYESIRDDGGRSADQNYEWDKNGNPTQFDAPSSAEMRWTYNTSGTSYNSDQDKPHTLKRQLGSGGNGITLEGDWNPFGPMKSYRQWNKLSVSSTYLSANFTWDKAYRPTVLQYKNTAGTNSLQD